MLSQIHASVLDLYAVYTFPRAIHGSTEELGAQTLALQHDFYLLHSLSQRLPALSLGRGTVLKSDQ